MPHVGQLPTAIDVNVPAGASGARPQHETVPPVLIPQEYRQPAETAENVPRGVITWFWLFLPQQDTVPSDLIPHE